LIIALRFRGTESLHLRFAIGRAAVLTAETGLHRRLDTRLHDRFLRAIVQGRLRRLGVVFEAFSSIVVTLASLASFASLAWSSATLVIVAAAAAAAALRQRNAALLQASRQLLLVQSREIFPALGVSLVIVIAAALGLTLLRRLALIVGKTGVNLDLQSLDFRLLGLSILLRFLGPALLQALAVLLELRIAIGRGRAAGNVAGDESDQNHHSLHIV